MKVETKPKKYVYDHGLPYDKTLHKNVLSIYQHVLRNKVGAIVLDGVSGEGKTTLLAQIGKNLDPSFDFDKQIGMGGADFMKKAMWCSENGKHILGYDEAGDFNKRGALTKFNQLIVRFFETYRTFKIMPIIALPKFWALDNHLFDLEIPKMLVHCYSRGKNFGNYKVYSLRSMFYMKNNLKNLKVKPLVYGTSTPNFHGHFLPLPVQEQLLLDSLSQKAKKGFIDNTILKSRGLVSSKILSQKIGITQGTVYNRLCKLKIKPVETIKNVKYYDEAIIGVLSKYKGSV